MAPFPIPLPCALAFPPSSHRDATTPSPCWAPHFMTRERIMFSNPTLSEPRLSPAATMSDVTPSALTPSLHCASILQPTTFSSSCRFSVLDHLCSNLSESFHPIPLPCALAFPSPSHRDTTTLSPCWAPHFMTHEHIMFSNPTPSKPRLSPAATIDATTSFFIPPLHCASILRPAAPPQVAAFESETISAPICLIRFTFAESRKSDL